MNEDAPGSRRATVHDVARTAGVSLATVDRVLNNRPGVRPQTAQKVAEAIAALGFSRDLSASLLARARDLRLTFLLPSGANEFMANLAHVVEQRMPSAALERMRLDVRQFPPLDAPALATELDALDPRQCDGAVLVGIEDDRVVTAVNSAARRGIALVTLVSDLPGSARQHFVGIDNKAAGRTAGSLLGRFCSGGGTLGVIMGSHGLSDHRERLDGFLELLSEEFPDITVLPALEGHEEPDETGRHAAKLIADHKDLVGIYNLGAGNAGLIEALGLSGRADSVRVIAHELTGSTRKGLRTGLVDVVLDQNPEGEITAAIAAARALALGQNRALAEAAIEIGVFLRDNLR